MKNQPIENQRALVPIKSESRNIQRAHVRRVERDGVKVPVLINRGKQSRSISRSPPRRAPAPKVNKPILSLSPRLRWQQVLKTDKPSKEIITKRNIERRMEKEGIKLLPGEGVAMQFRLVYPGHPMSVGGSIEVLDKDEGWKSVFMEYRMSGASLIEFLQQMQEEGKPVIYKVSDDVITQLDYARPFEKINVRENAIDSEPQESGFVAEIRPTGKGKEVEFITRTGRKKFPSWEAWHEADRKARAKGLDVLGKRLNPQTQIKDFKKKERGSSWHAVQTR